MSRIKEKLSKIFTAQIPEFIRVGDTPASFSRVITTVANTNTVIVDTTFDILVGDKLIHPSITNQVFVTNIISDTKLIVSNTIYVSLTARIAKFTRDNTVSNFVKFLEAYYKFLEQDQSPQELLQNARQYGDIDNTIETLIEEFFKTYAVDIPRTMVADRNTFLKHVKDVYQTKGSEEAYKILFRGVFDSDVSFFYPNDSVLKLSDGQWKTNKTLFIYEDAGNNPYDFINTKIVGANSNATAVVENVLQLKFEASSIYELTLADVRGTFLQEKISTNKLITAPATYRNVKATSAQTLIGFNIVDGSNGYSVNDDFLIYGANAKITNVTDSGKINRIQILRPYIFPKPEVQNNSYVPVQSNILNIVMGNPSTQLAGNVTIKSEVGTFISDNPHGLVKGDSVNLLSYGNTLSYLNSTEITISASTILNKNQFRFAMPGATNTATAANVKYTKKADITPLTGIVLESAGYWEDDAGKLSELNYIQGSSLNNTDSTKIYYQPFSYVVRSDVSIDNWQNLATDVLHPAGAELFGEININNEIPANVGVIGSSEVWDYFGLTADCDANANPYVSNVRTSSTTYSNQLINNLNLTSDMVYVQIGSL